MYLGVGGSKVNVGVDQGLHLIILATDRTTFLKLKFSIRRASA
jgi:hypothetical protein